MISFCAAVFATMLRLTAVSTLSSCTALQYMRCATFLAGFVFDTVLGFKGLLVFLVASIAVTIFACSLLTAAYCLMLITAALTIYRLHEAHSAFVALGHGLALPESCVGFWLAIQIAQRGPTANGAGFLQPLSPRQGPTPYTIGTTVHEQVSQQPPEDVRQYLADRLALFAEMQSGDKATAPTTVSVLADACHCISNTNLRTFGCSVCCPQRTNRGAHVILHPADLEEVIRTGRGEIHPLANTGSAFSRSRGNPCLPGTLALVYAPREYNEVCTVMRIIEAGAKYLASIDD